MNINLFLYSLCLFFLIKIQFSSSNSFHNKNNKRNPSKYLWFLEEMSDTTENGLNFFTDYNNPDSPGTNSTPIYKSKTSSGLSASEIIAIVIPCVDVIVGLGVATALMGCSAPAAAGAAVASPNVDITNAGINGPEAI